MPRGGPRPGSGRKKGSINKASAKRQAEIALTGETPLDFLLRIMRDHDLPEDVRLDAGKAAAPYVHPKLQAMTLSGDADNPISIQTITRKIVRPGNRDG